MWSDETVSYSLRYSSPLPCVVLSAIRYPDETFQVMAQLCVERAALSSRSTDVSTCEFPPRSGRFVQILQSSKSVVGQVRSYHGNEPYAIALLYDGHWVGGYRRGDSLIYFDGLATTYRSCVERCAVMLRWEEMVSGTLNSVRFRMRKGLKNSMLGEGILIFSKDKVQAQLVHIQKDGISCGPRVVRWIVRRGWECVSVADLYALLK